MNLYIFCLILAGQDLDVALKQGSRRGLTILEQVNNAEERKAFEALYREVQPVAKRTRVSEFLKNFPQSWLLAQVYEAGARASFELSDAATGLYYARESLKLYPENPLLTGSMAAVLANRGEMKAARERARETLDYLDRFRKPDGVAEKDWRPIAARLKATAIQVLGEQPQTAAVRVKEARHEYAGSASCEPCHKAQTESWKQTGMARMLRKVEPEGVLGDFTKLADFHEGAQTPARGIVEDGKYFIDLQRASGLWDRFRVDFTIGSKWQQAYATRTGNGELHVLPVQYNRLRAEWVNYWSMIDPPASERTEIRNFHRVREVTSYQTNCAPCHTSQPDSKSFLEPGVNCEMCHGPSAAHAKGEPARWSFQKVDHKGYVQVCAQCHAQSAVREPQAFPPRYTRRPYAEFSRKAFYRDGRFRETTFIVESFERSACYRKGEAHCGSCHDPHPANARQNSTSLKYEEDSNAMCLQCHPAAFAAVGHTKHEDREAAKCVNCHMPKIMNSLLFAARSHQIDDRPLAETSLRFGQKESPNACLNCHKEKDGKWLQSSLRAWQAALPKGRN
jgi:predicted CXXCH cytochrome family protein